MKSPVSGNLILPTRQESLRLWMTRNGKSFNELGRQIGTTGHGVSWLCDQSTMPTHRHAQLVALGVPAELLPEAMDIKPGPKPKNNGIAEAARQG